VAQDPPGERTPRRPGQPGTRRHPGQPGARRWPGRPDHRRSGRAPAQGRLGCALTILVAAGLLACLGLGAGRFGLGSVQALGGLGGTRAAGTPAPACGPQHSTDPDCRDQLFINSIQAYWAAALPQIFAVPYHPAATRIVTGRVSTGCGPVESGAGPFYCPVDQHVYLDPAFTAELASQTAAHPSSTNADFPQAYALAHAYGHHVQELLGTGAQARRAEHADPARAASFAQALELQADCFAGVWAYHASETTDAGGVAIFTNVSDADATRALQTTAATATALGTAHQRDPGFAGTDPAQRTQWFTTGLSSGDPRQCAIDAATLPG
jgi:uncharacterized protein